MQKLYDLLYRKNEKNYLLKRKHIDETFYTYDKIKKEFYLTLPKNFNNQDSIDKINSVTDHYIINSNSSAEIDILKSFDSKDKKKNKIICEDNNINKEINPNVLFLEERKELWKELDKKLKNRAQSINNVFHKSKPSVGSINKIGLLSLENPRKLRINAKIIREIINKRKKQNESCEKEQYLTSNQRNSIKKETYANKTETTRPEEKMNYLLKMSLECSKLNQYSSIIKDENNII